MGKRRNNDEGGPGQGWMVTFSDCMTLLLCFFVLLLTFSSFEEIRFDQLAGAFRTTANDSVMDGTKLAKESILELPDRPNNTPFGSDTPTDNDPENWKPRPPVELMDIYKHRDRTCFYLPSDRLFWGRGTSLTPSGRKYLQRFSRYMTMVGSRVIIAESHGETDSALGVRRAAAVMEALIANQHLNRQRFSIAASPSAPPDRFSGKPFTEITFLNVNISD